MTRGPRITTGRLIWGVTAVTLVGALLRFGGVLWGLPLQLHADEWVIVEYAIDLAKRNSFEPAFFARPDHLEIQLSYIAYTLWSHLLHGVRPEDLFAVSQAPFYAISRTITASFGTAMIPLGYLIGCRVSRGAGLMSATSIALFPPFVEHSRYATPDIPLTFTVMVVVLGAMKFTTASSRAHTWCWLALASAGIAAGVTVKYPAVVGLAAIAAAIVVRVVQTRRWVDALWYGAASLGFVAVFTFFLSPVLFTNFSEVRNQLTGQNSDGHLGASGLGFWGNLGFYAQEMEHNGGILLLVFAVIGAVWLMTQRRWDTLPLGIGFVFWVALSMLSLHWDRWGLPMYLTVVVLGGIGAWAALAWTRTVSWPAAHWVVITGVSLSGASLLMGSLAQVAFALAPDTRAVAANEIAQLGATPENTAYDGYTPFLTDGPRSIASDLTVVDGALTARPPRTELDFALTSSSMVGRYLADSSRSEGEVYRLLTASTEPIMTWQSIGAPSTPVIEIQRIFDDMKYLNSVAGGAMVGPTLKLYALAETTQ